MEPALAFLANDIAGPAIAGASRITTIPVNAVITEAFEILVTRIAIVLFVDALIVTVANPTRDTIRVIDAGNLARRSGIIAHIGTAIGKSIVHAGAQPVALVFRVQQITGALLFLADGTTCPVPAGTEARAGPVKMTGRCAEIIALVKRIKAGPDGLAGRVSVADIAERAIVFRVRIDGMRRTGTFSARESATLAQAVASVFTAITVDTEIGHAIGVFIAGETIVEFRLALLFIASSICIAIVVGGAGIGADRRGLLSDAVAVNILVVAATQCQDRVSTCTVVVKGLTVADERTTDRLFAVALTGGRIIAIGWSRIPPGTVGGKRAAISTITAETVLTMVGDAIRMFVAVRTIGQVRCTFRVIAMGGRIAMAIMGATIKADGRILFAVSGAIFIDIQTTRQCEGRVVTGRVLVRGSSKTTGVQTLNVGHVPLARDGVVAYWSFVIAHGAAFCHIAAVTGLATEIVLAMPRDAITGFIAILTVVFVGHTDIVTMSICIAFIVQGATNRTLWCHLAGGPGTIEVGEVATLI